jgi:hypothetical protein
MNKIKTSADLIRETISQKDVTDAYNSMRFWLATDLATLSKRPNGDTIKVIRNAVKLYETQLGSDRDYAVKLTYHTVRSLFA